jgi:DNA polymerase V
MAKGGKRAGAGRPKGGKYGEPCKVVRIPESRVGEVLTFLDKCLSTRVPLYSCRVRAGFPSPADDYIETYLDLNERYVTHPTATFFVIAAGDSMTGAGIQSGDMLVVDKSVEAQHGQIVIAAINGELTVKRLSTTHNNIQLLPENDQYPPININEMQDIVIWGVVKHVIKDL